jgi:hypothetical protein
MTTAAQNSMPVAPTIIKIEGVPSLVRLEVARGRSGTRLISTNDQGVESAEHYASRGAALAAKGLVLATKEQVTVAVPGQPKAPKAKATAKAVKKAPAKKAPKKVAPKAKAAKKAPAKGKKKAA